MNATLEKEKIKLDVCIIKNDQLTITGSSTCFANEKMASHVDIDELLSLYKQVIQSAKNNGVKIAYKHRTKHTINSLRESYESEYNIYKNNFSKLVEMWKAKMETGIYYGCVDDKELETIYGLRNEMNSMWNRTKPLSQIGHIRHRLHELLDEMPRLISFTI